MKYVPHCLLAFIRQFLRSKGVEIVRLQTHRGVSMPSDTRRLLGMQENVTVFDVGANRGEFSRSMLYHFPRGTFFAFEPVKTTFDLLQTSTKGTPQIRAVNCALGERDGHAKMTTVPLSGSNRIISNEAGATLNTDVIEMKTLTKFARDNGITSIDLLKTDCEGYDLNVLKGGQSLLESCRVSLVYCEVNMRGDGGHGDFFAMNDFLRTHGYSFYALYDYSGVNLPLAETFCNALWVNGCLST